MVTDAEDQLEGISCLRIYWRADSYLVNVVLGLSFEDHKGSGVFEILKLTMTLHGLKPAMLRGYYVHKTCN